MKKVSNCLYVHKSNLEEIKKHLNEEQIKFLNEIILKENGLCKYDIIKYTKTKEITTDKISLIKCKGFDTINEPIVGESRCYNYNGSYKTIKGGNMVYHHKHTFVSSDYSGFDVEKNKQRSQVINSISEIQRNKCRIGNLTYWNYILKKYNL